MKKILILGMLLGCFCPVLSASGINLSREITLEQPQDNIIEKPGSFIITDDDMIFVLDGKAANIKVFNDNGKLVNVFGREGMGPDEFVSPRLSSYLEPWISIADFGRKTFFIYKRSNKNSLEYAGQFLCLEMAYDLHLIDSKKILITGYKTDENREEYSLYLYDSEKKNYEYLLPTETSYGFKSHANFKNHYNELAQIGLHQFCDLSDDFIFFTWTADLKIMRIDRTTGQMISFGTKTNNYFKPYLTPALINAYNRRDHRLIYQLRQEMSYIRDIFVTTANKIGLVYVGPTAKNKGMNVTLQIYSSNGELIKEWELLKAKSLSHYDLYFYYRKNKKLFYIMDVETTADFDQFFKIYEFRIDE